MPSEQECRREPQPDPEVIECRREPPSVESLHKRLVLVERQLDELVRLVMRKLAK